MFELALLTYWYPTDIPFGWGEWWILEDVGIALTTHGGLRGMLARSHQSITLRQIFSTPIYCEGTPNMYINSRGRRAQYQYLRYPEFLSRSPVSRLSLARYHRLDSVLCSRAVDIGSDSQRWVHLKLWVEFCQSVSRQYSIRVYKEGWFGRLGHYSTWQQTHGGLCVKGWAGEVPVLIAHVCVSLRFCNS